MAQQADTSAEHRALSSTQPSISEKAADSASTAEAMDDSLPELQGKLELTEAEQATYKRYLRKTDLRLALFICCGYMFSFLNRVALSQSKPVGVVADMHLDDVTVPLSIFYVSYLIFQVPSNIVLKHVRPSLWLSFLAAAWSVTGALGALAKSKGGIIAVRFCIGMFEAGFTSGVIAVYASWYPRDQLSRRLGWMYSSASLASMWAGPAAAGLGSIKSDVLRPYQILFIFYGCSSLVWSVVAFFMVKDYPATCSFLDRDEKAVIRKIMVQQGTLAKTGEFSRRQLYRSLLDWRIWAWSVIGFSGNITANTGPLFAPIFTVEMGFGRIAGQGMSAIPNFVSFLVSFFSGTLAQWAGSNSVLLVYAQILNIVGLVMAVATTQSAVRFVGLCIFNGASILAVPTAPGWAVSNQSGTTKTSVAAAMVSAIGAFGGFAASYMYPGRDAPRYLAGHVANIAVCAFVAVATLAMRVSLQTSNRRREKNPQDISQMTSEEIADLGDRHPNFRYRL